VDQTVAVRDAKRALREYALARRRAADRRAGPGAGIRAADHFLSVVPVPRGAVISGYWPIDEEFDVLPLLRRLMRAGHVCSLPVVERKHCPLVFRAWRPGDAVRAGPFGLTEPAADAPVVSPRLLLVPLLAFDSQGFRLGYGGGYYDRSLAALRDAGRVSAVGMAFSEQQVESVPHTETDQRLDWIVTERGASPIRAS
jgi:5-formyltetrahydrofolate cyclo-ligase